MTWWIDPGACCSFVDAAQQAFEEHLRNTAVLLPKDYPDELECKDLSWEFTWHMQRILQRYDFTIIAMVQPADPTQIVPMVCPKNSQVVFTLDVADKFGWFLNGAIRQFPTTPEERLRYTDELRNRFDY